jgi:hypothetical protein
LPDSDPLATSDVRAAVRSLARLCFDARREIAGSRADDDPWSLDVKRAEDAINAIPDATWHEAFGGRRSLRDVVDAAPEAATALALLDLDTTRPLRAVALLRGLARSALALWFEHTHERDLVLQEGDLVPLVERPIVETTGGANTPRVTTSGLGHLLDRLPYVLFHDVTTTQVVLDFFERELLEPLLWDDAEARFPRFATLHPNDDWTELDYDPHPSEGWFFDVGPRAFDPEWICRHLRQARPWATIAILPELSLPSAYALAGRLAMDHTQYPPVIVSGSAHETEHGPKRSNVCAVYLDGRPILEHRKVHAMLFEGMEEHLTPEPRRLRILCTSNTHFAVAICADLTDDEVPRLLRDTGVNLLAVPALTPHEGGFGEVCGTLSSARQGVVVIANGAPPPDADGDTAFAIMAAAPVHHTDDQVRSYPPPLPKQRRAVGCLDPNVPLSEQDPWTLPPPEPSGEDQEI